MSKVISLVLLPRSFIVLYFACRSVIHFELIFVKGIRSVSRFFKFVCGHPFVPASYVEDAIFAPLYCLCAFVKDWLTVFVGVHFWFLHSVPLICLSTL